MEQGIYAVEVIQLAEFFLQDALNIFPSKRANFVFLARHGLHACTQPIAFLKGEFLPSSLSGATTQTFHARLVVATHPFLNRPP